MDEEFDRGTTDHRGSAVPSLSVCALIFVCLLLSRDPAILADAQFWAEEGAVWFAEAHRLGWHALFRPESTYLQTVSRLVACAATPLPLRWSPTAYAAVAFAIQLLLPVLFTSDRLDTVWPSRAERFAFGCLLMVLRTPARSTSTSPTASGTWRCSPS